MNDGTFKYAGHTFCPYARFNADYFDLVKQTEISIKVFSGYYKGYEVNL